MAASRRFCFLLIFLIADAGLVLCQLDGKPINITVVSRTRSLEVFWNPPKDYADLDVKNYRVRVYPDNHEELRRIQYVPKDKPLQATVGPLEPGIVYRVQVGTQLANGTFFTDSGTYTTSAEPGFLEQALKHWKFVVLGAGLASFLLLCLAACVWCCCCKISCGGRRRRIMHITSSATATTTTTTTSTAAKKSRKTKEKNKTKKGKKGDTNLPSAKELEDRERYGLENENRYSLDPLQSGTTWPARPSGTSTTNSRAPLVHDPLTPGPDELPPFLQAGPLSPSFPRNAAPSRPPLPWPKKSEEMEDEVFQPDDEVYANQEFFPQPPPEDQYHVYGNCQF